MKEKFRSVASIDSCVRLATNRADDMFCCIAGDDWHQGVQVKKTSQKNEQNKDYKNDAYFFHGSECLNWSTKIDKKTGCVSF